MAYDSQVVEPRETIPITGVRNLPGIVPRTLEIRAGLFRDVESIIVNDIELTTFELVSPTMLYVPLPVEFTSISVTSLVVASRRLSVSPTSIITFRMPRRAAKVRGVLRLLQLFLKVLLTTPGTDIFSPATGGGLLRALSRPANLQHSQAITSDAVLAVEAAAKQILAIQSRNTSLPADERLRSARVQSSTFDPRSAALLVAVAVESQAGPVAIGNVVV